MDPSQSTKMRQNIVLPALAVAGLATADDFLYSSRLTKRGIDSEGNFNMCMYHTLSRPCHSAYTLCGLLPHQ